MYLGNEEQQVKTYKKEAENIIIRILSEKLNINIKIFETDLNTFMY